MIQENEVHQGSCLCESVKYQIESDLKAIVHCHCRFCSKAHGAAFTTILFMPFADLTILKGAEFIERFHIEAVNADRCFCGRCGTRLYNHRPSTGSVSLVVATLNSVEVLRPVAHFNTESKCAWFQIQDELPQFLAAPAAAEFKQLMSS